MDESRIHPLSYETPECSEATDERFFLALESRHKSKILMRNNGLIVPL